jgi:hypothetical protein
MRSGAAVLQGGAGKAVSAPTVLLCLAKLTLQIVDGNCMLRVQGGAGKAVSANDNVVFGQAYIANSRWELHAARSGSSWHSSVCQRQRCVSPSVRYRVDGNCMLRV